MFERTWTCSACGKLFEKNIYEVKFLCKRSKSIHSSKERCATNWIIRLLLSSHPLSQRNTYIQSIQSNQLVSHSGSQASWYSSLARYSFQYMWCILQRDTVFEIVCISYNCTVQYSTKLSTYECSGQNAIWGLQRYILRLRLTSNTCDLALAIA